MVKKTIVEKIREVLKDEPQLTDTEAMKVVVHTKSIKSDNKKRKKKKKKKPKNDAMYKSVGGGFETNRRKH